MLALIIFSVLVFVHEFGHFIFAKLFNVKVNEFSIGMGPKILSKQGKETLYSLRLFPIGGFCAMEGEDEDDFNPRSINNISPYKRFIVISAGAIVNIFVGFIAIIIIILPQEQLATTTISVFDENATSINYGLEVGDRITSINGTAVFVDTDITFNMARDNDGVIDVGVERNGEKLVLEDVKFTTATEGSMTYAIIDFYVLPQEKTVWSVLKHGSLRTLSYARLVWLSLFDLVTGNVGLDSVMGPVGTVSVIGEAASEAVFSGTSMDWMRLLYLIALITINLGVFNLLPLPALDGGRLIFIIIEMIRRKPINPKYEGYVHLAGMALLIGLILIVTYSDIVRLITGG